MADVIGKLTVEIVGDNSKLDKSVKTTEKKTKKFASSLTKIFAGIGLAVVAKKMFDLGKAAEKAFQIQEAAEKKLQQTLIATGSAAGLTANELTNMASELQKVTKFGDEATIGAQSLLLTFKSIGGDVFPRALESILDVSEAMGQDLKTSTIQIGKALNDPIAGLASLTRVGIQFSQVQKDLIKGFQENGDLASAQGVILKELEGQFGGVARAAAETAEGIQIQLNNSIGDMQEAIGESISNGLTPWRKSLQSVVEQFTLLIQKQNIAKDFIRDFEDGSIDATRSIEELQITLEELNKQTQQSGRGGSQALKDQIQAVEALISAYGIEDTFLIKAAESQAALARASADEATKIQAALDLEQTVREKLAEVRAVELTEGEKQIEALQEQIDLWAQYRDVPGAQELINELIAKRNELIDSTTDGINTNIASIGFQNIAYNEAHTDMTFAHRAFTDSVIENNEEMALSAAERFELASTSALNFFQAFESFASASANAELARLKKSGASQEELEAKKKEIAIKEAKRKKALGIFSSAIDTASAIIGFLANPGGIPGIVLSVLAGVTGAVQIAAIASEPLPAFANGGVVGGNSFVGDKVPAMVNSGEMIFNKQQQSKLLEIANGSGGGATTVNAIIDKKVLFSIMLNGSKQGQLQFDKRSLIN